MMQPAVQPPTDTANAADAAPAAFPLYPMLWSFGLLTVLFFPVLKVMVHEWSVMEEMGHGFFVPFVAGYVAWTKRERILAQPLRPSYPAALLILWAFFQMVMGFLGADFFVARTAYIVGIVGIIWTLAGTAVLRTLFFPLFLLLFMIRLPLFLYQQLTFPLQLFASEVASNLLHLIGIPVLRDGNILELPSQRLQVIEACSGIRSLLSLSFLSLTYAHMFDKRGWMRPVLFLCTIPIAIGTNAIRVTLTGILSEHNKELADGFFHSFEGWMMFMVALACLIGSHRLINRFARPAEGLPQ